MNRSKISNRLIAASASIVLAFAAHPAYAGTGEAGNTWGRLALASQTTSKTQLVCRYARTGETRRQALKQEAVVVFQLPKSGKTRGLNCPRPSPGRTNLVKFTNNLRRHPVLGKLLLRLTMSPIHN